MITVDLDRALAAGQPSQWQPGADGPGSYVTALPLRLTRADGAEPGEGAGGAVRATAPGDAAAGLSPAAAAEALATRLRPLGWVAHARAGDSGFLLVTVTAETLARLAVRVVRAGAACAVSGTLAGVTMPSPPAGDLAAARDWREARHLVTASALARLTEAAGATVSPGRQREPRVPAHAAGGSVADSVAYAGEDAVRYALARQAPVYRADAACEVDPAHERGAAQGVDAALVAAHHVGNPGYLVGYAHALAASVLRQAAALEWQWDDVERFDPARLDHPEERALLDGISWLPERVASAARRGRPDTLAHHLESLAGAYLTCQERCPAVAPGILADGEVASGPDGAARTARLWLAAAARTALGTGLGLLGVSAPSRL